MRIDSAQPGLVRPPACEISTTRKWTGLLVALGVCFAVGALGGLFTSTSVDSWYQTLERPWWTPPDWVFTPVWLSLYGLMAVAVWDVWRARPPTSRPLVLFGVQLALNLGWSAVFFGLRSPGLALIEIALLVAAIAATMMEFWRHRCRAALLLVPYFLWTSFAAALNAAVWWMNRTG